MIEEKKSRKAVWAAVAGAALVVVAVVTTVIIVSLQKDGQKGEEDESKKSGGKKTSKQKPAKAQPVDLLAPTSFSELASRGDILQGFQDVVQDALDKLEPSGVGAFRTKWEEAHALFMANVLGRPLNKVYKELMHDDFEAFVRDGTALQFEGTMYIHPSDPCSDLSFRRLFTSHLALINATFPESKENAYLGETAETLYDHKYAMLRDGCLKRAQAISGIIYAMGTGESDEGELQLFVSRNRPRFSAECPESKCLAYQGKVVFDGGDYDHVVVKNVAVAAKPRILTQLMGLLEQEEDSSDHERTLTRVANTLQLMAGYEGGSDHWPFFQRATSADDLRVLLGEAMASEAASALPTEGLRILPHQPARHVLQLPAPCVVVLKDQAGILQSVRMRMGTRFAGMLDEALQRVAPNAAELVAVPADLPDPNATTPWNRAIKAVILASVPRVDSASIADPQTRPAFRAAILRALGAAQNAGLFTVVFALEDNDGSLARWKIDVVNEVMRKWSRIAPRSNITRQRVFVAFTVDVHPADTLATTATDLNRQRARASVEQAEDWHTAH